MTRGYGRGHRGRKQSRRNISKAAPKKRFQELLLEATAVRVLEDYASKGIGT